MVVAVKTLKDNAGERERLDLIQELQVMKSLEPHPHVVKLLGCCSDRGIYAYNLLRYVSVSDYYFWSQWWLSLSVKTKISLNLSA